MEGGSGGRRVAGGEENGGGWGGVRREVLTVNVMEMSQAPRYTQRVSCRCQFYPLSDDKSLIFFVCAGLPCLRCLELPNTGLKFFNLSR